MSHPQDGSCSGGSARDSKGLVSFLWFVDNTVDLVLEDQGETERICKLLTICSYNTAEFSDPRDKAR